MSEYRDDRVQGDSLAACISKYLASRQHELGEKTYGQTKLLLERLKDYCALRGVYDIRDLSVDLLETLTGRVSRRHAGLPKAPTATRPLLWTPRRSEA